VDKLGEIEHRMTIVPNATDDRAIKPRSTAASRCVASNVARRRVPI
jgi:hypothetical protein